MVPSRYVALVAFVAAISAALATAACSGLLEPEGAAGDAEVPDAPPDIDEDVDTSSDATITDSAAADGRRDSGTDAATTSDSGPITDSGSASDSSALSDVIAEAAAEAGADGSSDAGADADASPVTCSPPIHSGSSAVAYQIDPQHTGAQPGDSLTLPLCQRWSYNFGANAIATPVIANGLVFVIATPFPASQPAAYALDENTGTVVWGPVSLGGPKAYFPGGVTLDNGQLFALSGAGVVASLDPSTGTIGWQTQLTGQNDWWSSPVAVGGVVVVTGFGTGGIVCGVRETDGALLWTYSGPMDTSSPAMTSDAVFIHDNCGAAYRLDKNDGGLVWTHAGTCGGGGYHSVSVLDAELYVPTEFGYGAGVVIDPATGGTDGGTFDSINTPAASAGVGYFVPYLSRALAAVPLGSTTANWSAGSDVETSPLVVGSNVVVGTSFGIDVFSAVDGGLVSSAPVNVIISVTIGTPGLQEADGLLFVVSNASSNTLLLAY